MPGDAAPWKREVRAVAKHAAGDSWFGRGPHRGVGFGVGVVFRMPRPKAHFRTGRFAAELKPGAPSQHLTKPDFDNLLKAVLDAIGPFEDLPRLVWADDSQVCELLAGSCKRYTNPGETPGATIAIARLEEATTK